MTLQLFFTNKTKTIGSQFSPPLTQDPQPTTSTAQTPIFSFLSPHWGGSIQTSPLQPSYNMSSRPYPLTPSPSNLSRTLTSTHTHYQHISPHRHLPHCIQAGSSNPTAQKTYIKHFSFRKLQTCLSPSIHCLSQNNKLDAKQSGFSSCHLTEIALLSVTEALRIAKADSKSSVLILLDMSAAFDTVNHQILLSTLSSLDITGIPLRWFESYLTGRSFRVAWGGGIQSTSIGHWGSPGLGSWTPPLLYIH